MNKRHLFISETHVSGISRHCRGVPKGCLIFCFIFLFVAEEVMTVLVLLKHIAELLRRAVCHGGSSRVARASPCCSKHEMRRYGKYAEQLSQFRRGSISVAQALVQALVESTHCVLVKASRLHGNVCDNVTMHTPLIHPY